MGPKGGQRGVTLLADVSDSRIYWIERVDRAAEAHRGNVAINVT